MARLGPVAWIIALVMFSSSAWAQVHCESHTLSVDLGDLFALQGISGSFAKTDKVCSYTFEGNALSPARYKLCSDWSCQENLEFIDDGILNSLISLHAKSASVGTSNFGVDNSFTYTEYNAAQKSLKARQRLTIRLLGGKLRLPPHNFKITFSQPAGEGGSSQASWATSNFEFGVGLPVPTPVGTFELGLGANYADHNSEDDTADRSDIYLMARETQWPGKVDWIPSGFQNIAQSSCWEDFNLVNSWTLYIASPWIGADIGIASAKLRLKVSAEIEGKFHYGEEHSLTEQTYKDAACPSILSSLYSKTALATQASGQGSIQVRIKIPFHTYRKEFEIISESASSGDVFFPGSGHKLIDIDIPFAVQECGLAPCPSSPSVPSPPSLDALDNPPPPDTDDSKTDPTGFAYEVMKELTETYYICDKDKREWDITKDRYVQTIAKRAKQRGALSASERQMIEEYLRENVFLCERTCWGVCLHEGTDGRLTEDKQEPPER